jgi:hypothetical protein
MDQVSEISIAPRRTPLHAIRWPAIFAGLAVGISVQLLLMLIGIAAGLAAIEPRNQPDATAISVGAGVWNTISMLIASFIGGYVAARASGLRRTSDGVLHGVVSWGATMLLFAFLTTSALGSVFGGMFGLIASTGSIDIAQGGELTANAASAASGWLSAAIVLSLLAGIIGGSVGARGTRRMPRIEVRPTTLPSGHVPGAG